MGGIASTLASMEVDLAGVAIEVALIIGLPALSTMLC